jgi:hypothetical protein
MPLLRFSGWTFLSFRNAFFYHRLAGTSLLAAVIFCCAYSGPAKQKEYKYSVRGRVVDSQGQPVQGASVFLDPPAWAHQIFGFTTGPDGKFQLEEELTVPREARRLYVTGPIPPGAKEFISPPFNRLPKLTDPAFAGQLISIEPDGEADLGDVAVQINYSLVNVYILGQDGAPLLKKAKQWDYVNFRVRNVESAVVYDTSVSQKSIEDVVNLSESSIAIAMPEGVWHLEVAPYGRDGPWFASSDRLTIRGTGNRLQLAVRVSKLK